MDPLTTFLVLVAVLSVAAVIVLLRSVAARDGENKALREAAEAAKTELTEARREARASVKQADGLAADIKGLRQDLKAAKTNAFKAKERIKSAQSKSSRQDDWTAGKEGELRRMRDSYESLQAEAERLRARVTGLEQEAREAPPQQPETAASGVAPVDDRRVRELEGTVDRLEEKLARLRGRLDDDRGAGRQRDRDLITARKLAVQHERAFQVTRGQLDVARQRLAALGETVGVASEALDDGAGPEEPEAEVASAPAAS